jgi:hypothetical protein
MWNAPMLAHTNRTLLLARPPDLVAVAEGDLQAEAVGDRLQDVRHARRRVGAEVRPPARRLIDLIRRAQSSEPHVPAIWQSAIMNLIDGVATPYDYGSVERWLSEEYGGRSGLPQASGDRGP